VVQSEYKYNSLGQQAIRTLTQAGQVINSVYGPDSNRIPDASASGSCHDDLR